MLSKNILLFKYIIFLFLQIVKCILFLYFLSYKTKNYFKKQSSIYSLIYDKYKEIRVKFEKIEKIPTPCGTILEKMLLYSRISNHFFELG